MNTATRDGFGDSLVENNFSELIVLTADLAKATKVEKFKNQFPEQFIDVGIAECNLIGIASGLSEHGFKPVITSFASFITGKYDFIRMSIAMAKANVLIVGTHAGIAIGKDGSSQMDLESLALMRALPNLEIYQPSTYNKANMITKNLLHSKGPKYLRLGRQPVKEYYEYDDGTVVNCLYRHPSYGLAILNSGCLLEQCVEVGRSIGATVYDVSQIKPLPIEIFSILCYYDKVVTVEDHNRVGGFGSAILEYVNDNNLPTEILRIGLNETFAESGDPDDLYEKYELDAYGIKRQINEFLNK